MIMFSYFPRQCRDPVHCSSASSLNTRVLQQCVHLSLRTNLVDSEQGSTCQTSRQFWQATARADAHRGFHCTAATLRCRRCFSVGAVALRDRSAPLQSLWWSRRLSSDSAVREWLCRVEMQQDLGNVCSLTWRQTALLWSGSEVQTGINKLLQTFSIVMCLLTPILKAGVLLLPL